MFTRCPHCKTVHPLQAVALAHAHGSVRCGQCGKSFDALAFLFDDWPSGKAYEAQRGIPMASPVLGRPVAMADDNTAGCEEEPDEEISHNPHRRVWVAVLILLLVLTGINLTWTFREPLLQVERINQWAREAGWLGTRDAGLLHAPEQIRLISRDMHSHPTRTGILVLSLTFVNLAADTQVFPILELTLLDAVNQPVARRRLQPGEYLRAGADIPSGLAPDSLLPVLLEFADPGERASGFEVRFL